MPFIATRGADPAIPGMPTIRLMRSYQGLSQRRLAQLANIPPDRMWRLENAVNEPTTDELIRLWNVLSTGSMPTNTPRRGSAG